MKFRSRVAASASLAWFGSIVPGAWAQTPNSLPSPTPRTAAVAASTKGAVTGRMNLDDLTTTVGPRALAKVAGIASPGLKVTLDGSTTSGGRVWYRWVQSQGPKVEILGAEQALASFVVPAEGSVLGFVLVVGNSVGIDARAVQVDIIDPDSDDPNSPLRADAGENQTATVGRRVILDGGKSEPRGRIRYRWVQTSGPKVDHFAATGSVCSFVPETKGVYQFALLVLGTDGLISEVSVVKIEAKPDKKPPTTTTTTTAERPPLALDELARASLLAIDGGAKYAADLARAIDGVADRIDSFKTYFELATEMSLRLDAIVPRDPAHRADWTDHFFKPWTTRIGESLRDDGIDVTVPVGQNKPLTRTQRARLAEQFRFTAAGLRAGRSLR